MHLLSTRPMPLTNQGSLQHSGSRIHRSLEGTLIRRSSEESFRLCDAFVTETRFYHSYRCAEH